jgi:hypothetical protein
MAGEWKLVFDLRAEEAAKVKSVRVNGTESAATRSGGAIVVQGTSTPEKRLNWALVMM